MVSYDIHLKKYLTSLCLLLSFLLTKVECHIGQPCNVLGMCLPISSHIYCDKDNICRCRKEYPIEVGPHSCLSPKRVADRCSHPEECLHNDKNSHCNQSPYSSRCECNAGFVYDKYKSICAPETKNVRKGSNPALMIPTAAGLLMACFSLLCCCALIWHNLCRRHDIINRNAANGASSGARSRRTGGDARRGTGVNRRNQTNETQVSAHLPPYESILIDSMNNDPPPTYEDAIKDTSHPTQHTPHTDTAETKIT